MWEGQRQGRMQPPSHEGSETASDTAESCSTSPPRSPASASATKGRGEQEDGSAEVRSGDPRQTKEAAQGDSDIDEDAFLLQFEERLLKPKAAQTTGKGECTHVNETDSRTSEERCMGPIPHVLLECISLPTGEGVAPPTTTPSRGTAPAAAAAAGDGEWEGADDQGPPRERTAAAAVAVATQQRLEAEQGELLLQQLADRLLAECGHNAAQDMDRRVLPPSAFC